MAEKLQIIAGLFHNEPGYSNALNEFTWSVRQNSDFWQHAVLYLDPKCADIASRYKSSFKRIIIDDTFPEVVRNKPKWNCKGWWSYRGVQEFGRVLFCDFDIFVRKLPDDFLDKMLVKGPRFLFMPGYPGPNKIVGCGCAYYDAHCDWDKYLPLIFNKWNCDERAWTETMKVSRDTYEQSPLHMNPYIVNYDWILEDKENRREHPYIIHGLSSIGWGRSILRGIGYTESQIKFKNTALEEIRYWIHVVRVKLFGKSQNCHW